MTDRLIAELVKDLKPMKPLVNIKLWMHCTACLVMIAAMILGFMGLRDDYINAMQTGAMYWKSGLFFFIWISSILLITDISRPTGLVKKWHFIPLALGIIVLIWQFSIQISDFSFDMMIQSLKDKSTFVCLPTIFFGGIMAMALTWKFWFTKTASANPALLGFLSGLSAGTLAATAYALHCNHDTALYVLLYYGAPILVLSIIGALLGKKLLKW